MSIVRSMVVDLSSAQQDITYGHGREVRWFLAWTGTWLAREEGLLLPVLRFPAFPLSLVCLFNLFQKVNTIWRSFKFWDNTGFDSESGTLFKYVRVVKKTGWKCTDQIFPATPLDVCSAYLIHGGHEMFFACWKSFLYLCPKEKCRQCCPLKSAGMWPQGEEAQYPWFQPPATPLGRQEAFFLPHQCLCSSPVKFPKDQI